MGVMQIVITPPSTINLVMQLEGWNSIAMTMLRLRASTRMCSSLRVDSITIVLTILPTTMVAGELLKGRVTSRLGTRLLVSSTTMRVLRLYTLVMMLGPSRKLISKNCYEVVKGRVKLPLTMMRNLREEPVFQEERARYSNRKLIHRLSTSPLS